MDLSIFYICAFLYSASLVNGEMLGKFIFHGGQDYGDQKNLLNVLHKPDSVQFAPNPGSIPSNEIARVLSLSLGLSIPKDITWAGLQVSNPFNLPKAVMMLSIDNLPKGNKLKLAPTATFPIDEKDGVTSIGDMYYISPKYSLSSHVGAIFEGQSKIVSVSGDEKVASSGYSNTPSSTASVWSELTDCWKLITGDGVVHDSLTKEQVLKRIPGILFSGYTYNEMEKTVSVNIKGLEFTYNLEDKVDFKLFSELVYIMWQYQLLETQKSEVRDNAPDLYLLSISALKDIEKKYGADSKQMQGALLLLEKFVGKIVKYFVKLYDGNIFVVGITTTSDMGFFDDHKDDFKPIMKVLQDNKVTLQDFNNMIPELHVVDKLEEATQSRLCEAIQGSVGLLGKSLKFMCAHEMPTHRVSRRSLLSTKVTTDLNLASSYDAMFPVIFNMWFWLIVILALTVYAVSVGMWNMDPGEDSIIYRLTQQKIK